MFGLRESELRALTDADPVSPTLALGCREVFARGQRPIEVIGPLLEDEARAVHDGFWTEDGERIRWRKHNGSLVFHGDRPYRPEVSVYFDRRC